MKYFQIICISLALYFTLGCGGLLSDSSSSIAEVSTRDQVIIPGARTEVRVRFWPGNEFLGYDFQGQAQYVSVPFGITLFLPTGVTLVERSSKVTDSLLGDVLFGNPDKKQPIERGSCSDGRSFFRYFFQRNEITDSEPLALVTFYLKFEADVTEAASGRELGATISYQHDACDEDAEEATLLRVGN